MVKRKGKNQKALRRRQKMANAEALEKQKVPRSMILHRGSAHVSVKQLVRDLRQVMMPNTAERLKAQRKNQLKDFISVAPFLGVSHMLVFNQKHDALTMRIARVPRGPTLTFNVLGYSLMRDIAARQKRPHSPGTEFQHGPLVVLNSFSSAADHVQIMSSMFQNMFEPIDLKTLKLNEVRRVVLLHRDSKAPADSGVVQLRHFLIKAVPVGVSRRIGKLLRRRKIPNLGELKDISQFVEDPHLDGVMSSDSEGEDAEENRVTLAQNYVGRGNQASQQSAIRLKEIGPRVTLQLLKIEEEINGGRVLYHRFISRSQEEVEELQRKKQEAVALKRQRKAEQLRNVNEKRAKAGLPPLQPTPDSDDDDQDAEDAQQFFRPDEDRSSDEDDDADGYYSDGAEEAEEAGSGDEAPGRPQPQPLRGAKASKGKAGSANTKSDAASTPGWLNELVQKAVRSEGARAAGDEDGSGDADADSSEGAMDDDGADDDSDAEDVSGEEDGRQPAKRLSQNPPVTKPAGGVVEFVDERKLRRKQNNKVNRKRRRNEAQEAAAGGNSKMLGRGPVKNSGNQPNKRQKRSPAAGSRK